MHFNYAQESVRQTHHEQNLLIYKRPFALDGMESLPRCIGHARDRASTVGAAEAVAESLSNCRVFRGSQRYTINAGQNCIYTTCKAGRFFYQAVFVGTDTRR